MKTKTRILKKHVGRPVDFYGWNRHENVVCHGRIAEVRNGQAKLEDSHRGRHQRIRLYRFPALRLWNACWL